MECLEAQRIVSERLDNEEIEAALLEEAKDHCRSCEECAAFVRTLAKVRMVPLPQPPEGLTERIMEAIAVERAMAHAADATRLSTPPEAELPAEETTGRRLARAFRDPRNRRTVVAWVSAAAVVLVVAAIGAASGVRQILSPTAGVRTYEVQSAAPQVTEKEYSPSGGSAADSAVTGLAQASAPSYITVGTSVYLLGGQASSVASESLTEVGTTTSSLGGTQVTQHSVFSAGDASTVYVIESTGGVLEFTRVTREFGGRTYALSGAPVTEYGKWPPLPPGFKTPTTADGSPEFVAAGTDSQGVRVYKRRGGSTADGIAVAPGSGPEDPAAGNPNWTWWEAFSQ